MHTENTRASYPINFIPNASRSGLGGHPRNIFFLTADAFGVMPPISRLTHEQAMYHFLSGYTARVAGTEKGMSSEPSAVFSTCFGAPFMVHFPHRYAELLGERLARHQPNVWLINTGWIGGPYGVGERIKIAYSRAMVRAALNNQLDDVPTHPDPIFGLHIPEYVPDVPAEALNARGLWADPDAYDAQATKVARLFHENFAKYANGASEAIKAAGPLVS